MWHHVTNHSVDDLALFDDPHDRRRFLDLIAELSPRHGVEVHVHCLMGNHYHLQIRSTAGHLSAFMRDLGGRYSRYFNRRHQRRGPLFRSRFHSVVITSDEQLVTTWVYIHRNPTEIGVRNLARYPWSSAGGYLGLIRPPPWLHTAVLAAVIGPDEMHRLLTSSGQR